MSTHEVVLSERAARRMLNNEPCRVIIELAHPREIFVTEPPLIEKDGITWIHIPQQSITVPVEDITKIEVGNRFNPDIHTMMKIAWSDDVNVVGDKEERTSKN